MGEVDGLKVVLGKDTQGNDIAVAQMTIGGGFVDIDGDDLINVALFNRETKVWDLEHDIKVARSIEDWKGLPANVYQLVELQSGSVLATMTVVGYKFEASDGKTSLKLLTFYKNRIIGLQINELLFSEIEREIGEGYVTTRTSSYKLVEAEKLSVNDVISLLGISRNMTLENLGDINVFAVWDILPSEATMANCDSEQRSLYWKATKTGVRPKLVKVKEEIFSAEPTLNSCYYSVKGMFQLTKPVNLKIQLYYGILLKVLNQLTELG